MGHRISNYRADIDGLRAIAVSAVLAFHAFPNWVQGGFVGVDIFFVISGYLISGIIFQGLSTGDFRFSRFYANRIRRIFPALALMLTTLLVVGWFWLNLIEYGKLGQHTAAGMGFVSNLVLWSQSGYFDAASETKPLLHLWSLGVEEQFYLLWPLCLFLLWRLRLNLRKSSFILGLLLFSFALNVVFVEVYPIATFYEPFSRLWELLAGSILAYCHRFPNEGLPLSFDQKSANLRSALGFALVATAIVNLRPSMAFPGWLALIPILGTFLIISAGPNAWLNKNILSHPWAVFLGLISYPLYLWHWPLLVLNRQLGDSNSGFTRLSLLGIAIFLAWLTYYFLERPIRFSGCPRGMVAGLVSVGLLVCGFGFVVWQRNGVESRFPSNVVQLLRDYNSQADYRYEKCFLITTSQGPGAFDKECYESGNGKTSILLWGDSHAAHLYPGLKRLRESQGFALSQLTATSCPPLIGGDTSNNGHCEEINEFVQRRIAELKPSIVILGSRWSRDERDLQQKIDRTAAFLAANGAQKIYLVGPPPRWDPSLKDVLLHAYRSSNVIPERLKPESVQFGETVNEDKKLKTIATSLGIHYLSLVELLCDQRGCLTRVGDNLPDALISSDYDHLTALSSEYVLRELYNSQRLSFN